MVVALTQADIDNCVPGDCLRDEIATALRRITGIQWRVTKELISPEVKGFRAFHTPRAAARLIEDSDNGRPVKPISFELR